MKGRPAESLAGASGIGLLVAFVLGVRDPETVAVVGAGVSLVPALVSLLVDAGGIRGVLKSLWRGKDRPGQEKMPKLV